MIRRLLFSLVLTLFASSAFAQAVPFASLPGSPSAGDFGTINDGGGSATPGDPCAGGGSAVDVCMYNGSAWQLVTRRPASVENNPNPVSQVINADQVAFDPSGNSLTATDVQAALVEAAASGGGGGDVNTALDTDGDGNPDFYYLAGDANGDTNQNAKDLEHALGLLTDTGTVTVVVRGTYGTAGLVAATESGTPLVTIARDAVAILCEPQSGFAFFPVGEIPSVSASTPILEWSNRSNVSIDGCRFDGGASAAYTASGTVNSPAIRFAGGSRHTITRNEIRHTDGHGIQVNSNNAGANTTSEISISGNRFFQTGKFLASNSLSASQWGHAIYLHSNVQAGVIEDVVVRANEALDTAGAFLRTSSLVSSGTNATRVRRVLLPDNVSRNAAARDTGNAAMYYLYGAEDVTISGGLSDGDERGLRIGGVSSYCAGGDDECVQRITVEGLSIQNAVQHGLRLSDWAEQVTIRDLVIEGGGSGGSDGILIDSPSQDILLANLALRDIPDRGITFSYSSGASSIPRLTIDGLRMENVGSFGFAATSTSLTQFLDLAIRRLEVDEPGNDVVLIGAETDVIGFELSDVFADLSDGATVDAKLLNVDGQSSGKGQFRDYVLRDIVVEDWNPPTPGEAIKVGRWGAGDCVAASDPDPCCVGLNDGPTCADSGPGVVSNVTFVWSDVGTTPTGVAMQGVDFQDEQVPSGQETHVDGISCLETPTVLGQPPGASGFDCVGSVGAQGHTDHLGFTASSSFVEDEDPLVNAADVCRPGQIYRWVDRGTAGSSLFICDNGTTGFRGL